MIRRFWIETFESALCVGWNSHRIEGSINEDQSDHEECRADCNFRVLILHRDCDFNCKQAEKRGELDHRIQADGTGVLEGIADGVANDGCFMKRGSLGAHVDFDDLLGIIPSTTGVCHKNGLEKTKERDGDQISDEEEWIEEGECQRQTEDDDEDVDHALLCIDRADSHNFFRVLNTCSCLFKIDVVLDIDHGSVRARHNGLGACSSEPVND